MMTGNDDSLHWGTTFLIKVGEDGQSVNGTFARIILATYTWVSLDE